MGEKTLAAPTSAPAPAPTSAVHLRRDIPILLRPGGRIQFGAAPESAVVLPLPEHCSPGPVWSAILAASRGDCLHTRLSSTDLDAALVRQLIAELRASRLVVSDLPPHVVTIIGRDRLKHMLYDEFRRLNRPATIKAPTRETLAWLSSTPVSDIGLVVLTGMEVPFDQVIEVLWQRRIPHVCFGVRDGRPVCGPLCVPGYSPCPMCVEMHRREVDGSRELLALQLKNQVGHVSRQVLAVAVSVALAQIDRIVSFGAADSPLLATHVVLDVVDLSAVSQPVLPHPDCPVCSSCS